MISVSLNSIPVGAVLLLLQVLLALPWLAIAFLTRADWEQLRSKPFPPWLVQRLLIALAVCFAVPILIFALIQDTNSLEIVGRTYAAILQVQLTLDVFILGFALLLSLWPKGGAVA